VHLRPELDQLLPEAPLRPAVGPHRPPRQGAARALHIRTIVAAHALAFVYPLGYYVVMIEIRRTEVYANRFDELRDRQARALIDVRIHRLSLGIRAMVGR
jgi:hypothetical protein